MCETVSNNSSLECLAVPPERVRHLLRWIHFDLSENDFATLLDDVEPRLVAEPKLTLLQIIEGGSPVAAAYFIRLDGSVATLGGLRATSGFEAQAGLLLQEFQGLLNRAGIAQIQALLNVDNLSSRMVMLNSPFRQVTTVRQLCLDLHNVSPTAELPLVGYTCQPASQFTRRDVEALVEATFSGSLDCPVLEGLRTGSEVVQGFLESQAWDQSLPWWVLCDGPTPIGCALVNTHLEGSFEFAYTGLIQSVRGRGLGRALVDYAIRICRERGGSYVTTAVDSQNWPACKIYDSLGFTEIRELAVWLPKVAKNHQVAAA